ncbi:hypothetical protein TRFO_27491 [Tritrichomonas foetus]|uniref:HEAT repeat family protein n=1 Tax=Tritrichomonas foetus TaxID=1144522 RepID=A0A1J4K1U6_9EUKA|nr:hypothetical protein TRFO_27491 [Tritrichomonas foetus]|eukprot:OHT04930.1 hypothetical protein TRFO_27491 [Tritrichomonas foetus]
MNEDKYLPTFSPNEINKIVADFHSTIHNDQMYALSNLKNVAKFFGPDRTLTEILPWVLNKNHPLSFKAAFRVAQSLAFMLDLVGGPEKFNNLLAFFNYMFGNEHEAVRIETAKSLTKICTKIPQSLLVAHLYPFVRYLVDQNSPLDVVGAFLICNTIDLFPDNEFHIFCQVLLMICQKITTVDQSQSNNIKVFVIISTELHKIITLPRFNINITFELIKLLATSTNERILIPIPSSLAAIHQNIEFCNYIFTQIFNANLQSVKVIISLLENVDVIYQIHPHKEFLILVLNSCSKNPDSKVRVILAKKLPFFSKIFPTEVQSIVSLYIKDPEILVRETIAASISEIELNQKQNISELAKDKNPKVRVATLECICKSGNCYELLTPLLTDTIALCNWRTKKSISQILVSLAKNISSNQFFTDYRTIINALLVDGVKEVRVAAEELLIELKNSYGEKLMMTRVLPIIKKNAKHPDYKIRQESIHLILKLGFERDCMDVILAGAKDPVPNVRMVLARELPERFNAILNKLKNDQDPDVAMLAKRNNS